MLSAIIFFETLQQFIITLTRLCRLHKIFGGVNPLRKKINALSCTKNSAGLKKDCGVFIFF